MYVMNLSFCDCQRYFVTLCTCIFHETLSVQLRCIALRYAVKYAMFIHLFLVIRGIARMESITLIFLSYNMINRRSISI